MNQSGVSKRRPRQSLQDSSIAEFSVEFQLECGSVELTDLAWKIMEKLTFHGIEEIFYFLNTEFVLSEHEIFYFLNTEIWTFCLGTTIRTTFTNKCT